MSTDGTKERYFKVGPVDVAYAGKRTSVLVGPVRHRGPEYTDAAFRQLARRGPSSRIGLQPSSSTNKWLFAPNRWGTVSVIEPCAFDEMLTKFEAFVAEASSQDVPVVVTYCGDYVMLSFDHGIGDATACLELTAVASGADITEYSVPNTRHPLRSALTRTASESPRSFVEVLRRASRPAVLPTRPYPRPDARDIVMTHIKTGPEFLATVKEMRKQYFPKTSITAAVVYALRSAFEAHGAGTTDDLSVLVDLRRFLGEGKSTLANLSAVVDLSVPASVDINEFGTQFAAAVSGATPLVKLAGSVAKRRLRGWSAGAAAPEEWPVKTRLTFSDPTRHPSIPKIRWDDSDQPLAYVLINDPTLPHQITITAMCDRQQCFQFTASYFAGSYQRADIDQIIAGVARDPSAYFGSALSSGVR
jgi:hypothetical protein